MHYPLLDDTIVALSSAWAPAPLGIVRISGPAARSLLAALSPEPLVPTGFPFAQERRLRLDDGVEVGAWVAGFCAPHSYTGQDVVELHTAGCLPLLRMCMARLIAAGARRALPGEFTARAVLNGKLGGDDVDRIAELIYSVDDADERRSARLSRNEWSQGLETLVDDLAEVVARLEAGIDFADEEDVRFIAPEELRVAIRRLDGEVRRLAARAATRAAERHPHVALVGLPNAGKSTLFNRLLGRQRALVSPVAGTTRDVLSASLRIGAVCAVLQDSAGLGATSSDLDLAMHRATEQAAELADLIVWVHDGRRPWSANERESLTRVSVERRVLVISRLDECDGPPAEPDVQAAALCRVSAATGQGIAELRTVLEAQLKKRLGVDGGANWIDDAFAAAERSLLRAANLLAGPQASPAVELVALDLREAWGALERARDGPQVEAVLERIYRTFCVGK